MENSVLLHKPKVIYDIDVYNGIEKISNLNFKGNSYVRNAYNMMIWFGLVAPALINDVDRAGGLHVRTPGGINIGGSKVVQALRTDQGSQYPHTAGPVGQTTQLRGIVVGSGSAAETLDDINLQTVILHSGTAGVANTLNYQTETGINTTYTPATKTWSCSHIRRFNNDSGGTITVREVGYFLADMSFDGISREVMLIRDLLPSPVDVPTGFQLQVTMERSLVFPV